MSELIYDLEGWAGHCIKVYDDKAVVTVKKCVKSIMNGTAMFGEKTILYSDCVAIQYKKAGLLVGFMQFELPGTLVSHGKNQALSENTFAWDTPDACNSQMDEVAEYVKGRIEHYKQNKNSPAIMAASSADELRKFKELLDMDIITQEEFDAKKKQLLGL